MSIAWENAPRPPQVLIVDDDRRSRQLLEAMLNSEGLVLRTAEGGEQAATMVDQDPPDLILRTARSRQGPRHTCRSRGTITNCCRPSGYFSARRIRRSAGLATPRPGNRSNCSEPPALTQATGSL